MLRHQFNRAIYMAGKFFNQQACGPDGKLDDDELDAMCIDAQTFLRGVFQDNLIQIMPYKDAIDDFAGFQITHGQHDEIVEFDFGSIGIDVI